MKLLATAATALGRWSMSWRRAVGVMAKRWVSWSSVTAVG
jgi:hypothetical protein